MARGKAWLVGVLCSTAVLYLSFPPRPFGFLIFFGLVPGFIAIEYSLTVKQAFARAWFGSILGNCVLCPWVAHCLHEFAGMPWVLAYPAVIAFSLFEQFSWPVMAGLRYFLHYRLGTRPILWAPAALMVLDASFPKLFPSTLGIAVYRIPWLAQAADFTGLWALSALIVATNEVIAMWWMKRWPRAEWRRHAFATAVFFVAVVGYGAWRNAKVMTWMQSPAGKLRVALVQPNINSAMKVRAEKNKTAARAVVLALMQRLTRQALAQNPDLIFWPETSFPTFYHSDASTEDREITDEMDAFLKDIRTPLLFGAKDGIAGHRYNSLFLVNSGGDRQVYHKVILLLLGEYLPLVDLSPRLQQFFLDHNSSFFSAGTGLTILTVAGRRLGPMICLEGLYPGFVRKIANAPVDLLVNATNDSWYGPGDEPELHLALTAMRAIETRRPLVRATNTGISAVVDIDGSLRKRSPRDQEAVVIDDVPIYSSITSPYANWGNLWLIVAGIWVVLPFVRHGKRLVVSGAQ
jgi:apolipoprotein N-acyltransferase